MNVSCLPTIRGATPRLPARSSLLSRSFPRTFTPPIPRARTPTTRLGSTRRSSPRFDRLDVTLLGLGEDGHVASLFPGAPSLEETSRLVVPVYGAPKPPPVRISMTLPAINRSRSVHMLVSGPAKRDALVRALTEAPPRTPAGLIRPEGGAVFWVDRAAAP